MNLAIVDITRGAGHGSVEIAEMLNNRFGTRIVFLTAQNDPATRGRIIKLSPVGYLFKPYAAHALRQLLETYEIK